MALGYSSWAATKKEIKEQNVNVINFLKELTNSTTIFNIQHLYIDFKLSQFKTIINCFNWLSCIGISFIILYLSPAPLVMASITLSKLKLPGSCRGGNSLKL